MSGNYSRRIQGASTLAVVGLAGLLVGCLDSGSSGSSSNEPTGQTEVEAGTAPEITEANEPFFDTEDGVERSGVFVDAPVDGLGYWAPSNGERKYTANGGELNYRRGELITFYIGDIVVGSTVAGAYVTPMNIIPNGGGAHSLPNLVRLLQSLDEHPDNDSLITIPSVAGTELEADSGDLDLSLDPDAFNDSDIVQELLERVDRDDLVSLDEAINHLNASMAGLDDDYSLSMPGTAWRFISTNTACPGMTAETRAVYHEEHIALEGKILEAEGDQCVTESWEDRNQETVTYDEVNELLDFCGPNCSFADLNQFASQDVNPDGSTQMVSHVPGTGVFSFTDYGEMNGEPYELHENRAIDMDVDLRGTWQGVTTNSECVDAELHATYSITETSLHFEGSSEFQGGDGEIDCSGTGDETHTFQFTSEEDLEDLREALPWAVQGSTQQLAWLNRSFVRSEETQKGRAQVMRIAYTPAEPDTINIIIEADNVTEYQTLTRTEE